MCFQTTDSAWDGGGMASILLLSLLYLLYLLYLLLCLLLLLLLSHAPVLSSGSKLGPRSSASVTYPCSSSSSSTQGVTGVSNDFNHAAVYGHCVACVQSL
jgi:hypothetical protein